MRGGERLIEVPVCRGCAEIGPDINLVSVVVVARLGAEVSNVLIDAVGMIDQRINGLMIMTAACG